MTDLHEEAERLAELPALRSWQEKARHSGPFQVPEYEDFTAIVQEHEALAARLAEVERARDAARADLSDALDRIRAEERERAAQKADLYDELDHSEGSATARNIAKDIRGDKT